MTVSIPLGDIARRIFTIRGQKVMLDRDLAALYGVTTFNLNKAVKRNRRRFPPDFMLQLSKAEFRDLIFQSGISKRGAHGGSRYCPYAFTEQGVAMLSSVLRSEQAIDVNVTIMRAFVHLRRMSLESQALAAKLDEVKFRVGRHDGQIANIFEMMRRLTGPGRRPPPRIGFKPRG